METKTKVSLIYQKSSFAPIHSHYYAINWKKEPMVLSVDVLSLWPVLNVHHNICFFPFHFCQVICLIKSRHCKYLTKKSIHFEHLIEMLTPRWPLIERNFRALCSIICQWLKWFACNMWWSRVIISIFIFFYWKFVNAKTDIPRGTRTHSSYSRCVHTSIFYWNKLKSI